MIIRILLAIGAVSLAAAIVWAMSADDRGLGVVLGEMVKEPWTIVTLIDLYLGFFIAAIIMIIFEKRLLVGLAWAAPVFFVGNIWTAVWLIVRLPALRKKL